MNRALAILLLVFVGAGVLIFWGALVSVLPTIWKKKIADSLIFTTNDGRVVFYPFGPLKGYLLPKTAFEQLIIKSIIRFNVGALASFIVTAAIGWLLNISMDVLLLIGLLDYVHYYFRIRRITRNLIALPRPLSIRVYAWLQDPERMWKRFWSFTFMTIMCGVLAFLVPPSAALFWVLLALLFARAVISACLIYLHHRENCATKEPNNPMNHLETTIDRRCRR